jgi:hypothetical protein
MMRRWLALVAALGAGCATTLDLADYPTSCAVAADCVPVVVGDVCHDCACPNAAIARAGEARYLADRQGVRAWCPATGAICSPCYPVPAVCDAGQCALAPP